MRSERRYWRIFAPEAGYTHEGLLHNKVSFSRPEAIAGLRVSPINSSMTELQTTTSVLGAGLAFLILFLLRRDHLYLRDALFWVSAAAFSLIFGLSPRLMDRLAALAGVSYSPTFFLLIAVLVLLIKALMSDLAITSLRRDLRRLNQRVALLEIENKKIEQ